MMFDVPNNTIVESAIPIITDNYSILLFDEFPMLFTGSNEYGNTIVGSLMCEDEENDIFRYIHLLVKPKDYTLFMKKKLSYRELLEKQETVFFLDKTFDEDVIKVYNTSVSLIPAEYLPLPNVYSPASELVFGSGFIVSLKGQMADVHEAIADRVTIVSKGVNQVLTTLSDIFKTDLVIPELRLVGTPATSFGLSYKLKFTATEMFFDEEIAQEVLAKSLDYSINYLPAEVEKISRGDIKDTHFEEMIEEPLARLHFGKVPKVIRDKAIKQLLKVPSEMEKVTDQLGMGFNYIEINSVGKDNQKSAIGIVDSQLSDQMDTAKDIIEAASGNKVEIDNGYTEYKIHVYHLNNETRKGNAHIGYKKDNKDILDSPKIQILGEKPIEGSEFIDSMDTGTYITVKAKAKKVNGRFKFITIDY